MTWFDFLYSGLLWLVDGSSTATYLHLIPGQMVGIYYKLI